MSKQPSFFVVGAAKSGTTALWTYFQKHPEIFVTDDIAAKELGYFSNQYGIVEKERYYDFFSSAKEGQKIGEVCHVYLSSEESAQWIKNDVPDAKIVIILRNPVKRAYSLYNWMVMHGYEWVSSFEKALSLERHRMQHDRERLDGFKKNYEYFHSGLYADQVKRYFEVFGKENVLLLTHEVFMKNQLESLNSVYDFIGVSKVDSIDVRTINKSKDVFSVRLQYYFRRRYLKAIKVKKRRELYERHMNRNTVSRPPKKLSDRLVEKLEADYKQDVLKLSKLCSYDFYDLWFGSKKDLK